MRSTIVLKCIVLCALAAPAFSGPEKTAMDVDQLLQAARARGGKIDAVQPAPEQLGNLPDRMLAYYATGMDDYLAIRVPVPAAGYYALRGRCLWGPWRPGRLGRFSASAGSVSFPGVIQGWYGNPPAQPFLIRDIEWGIAHFTPPAVEVRWALTHDSGNLLLMSDLRLEPVTEATLTAEQAAFRVPAIAAPEPEPAPEPFFRVQRIRNLEWTTFVRHAERPIAVDGDLSDWPRNDDVIVIDASIIPDRGWGAPPPQSDTDLSAKVQMQWDADYLYIAAQVMDDELMSPDGDDAWQSPFTHDGLVVITYPPGWLTTGFRSGGPAPQDVSFGLSYYAPGLSPRPLAGGARYVAVPSENGYVIEAAIPFKALGWTPAQAGDRLPLGLILVDLDPSKSAEQVFTQYGWNFGPGSAAGAGELRLLQAEQAAGELIAARRRLAPGNALEYVGSVDVQAPSVLEAIEVIEARSGRTVLSAPVGHSFERRGRYSLSGCILPEGVQQGDYELHLRWR